MAGEIGAIAGPVLVTGGRGFLGSWVIRRLRERGVAAASLDLTDERRRMEFVMGAEAAAAVPAWRGDIRRADDIRRALAESGARSVVHLAALTIPACRANPALGAEVDVVGHVNVLEEACAAGISTLVYSSSIAALPRPPLGGPVNLYGVWKRACEEAAKVYFLDRGLASIGLRPNVVYGPGRDEGETAAFTLAMRAAVRGEAYAMPFAGRLCLQHVDEVVEIVLRCLAARPTAPVVSDLTVDSVSVDEVIAAIRAEVPGAQILPAQMQRAAPEGLDNAPLRQLIGGWERVGLAEGVRRTVEVFRARG